MSPQGGIKPLRHAQFCFNRPVLIEMILTPSSSSSEKESRNPWRRHSDLPPSYDAAEAEPHGFADGKLPRALPIPIPTPPAPLISEDSSSRSDPLNPVRRMRDSEPSPVHLDPSSGEPRATYMVSDALLAQCAQFGHVEKTKFGALSILAATVFFPWGLICLMGSRVVYCERCGLVLRSPRGCKAKCRDHHHKRGDN